MTSKAISKHELLRYTWPPLLGSLGGVLVGITDSALVSYYSTSALASVSLGAAMYELPVNALMGALMAHRILAPRVPERGETTGLKIMLTTLVPAASALAIVIVAALLGAHTVVTDSIWATAFHYLLARTPSLIFDVVTTATAITLVAWGHSRAPFLAFLVSGPTNLLLDVVLVYGIGPLHPLGALGAGLGSTVAAAAPMPLLISLIKKHRQARKDATTTGSVTELYSHWHSLAWPSVGSAAADYGGNIVFMTIISASGAGALAGLRFGLQLHVLLFIFISSISSATLFIVGQKVVHDKTWISSYKGHVHDTFRQVGLCLGLLFLLVGLGASPLVSPDPQVVKNFQIAVVCVGLLAPAAAATYAEVTLLRLLGRTDKEFKANMFAVWLAQIPVAIVLQHSLGGAFTIGGLLAYWVARGLIARKEVFQTLETAYNLTENNPTCPGQQNQ